MDLHFDNIYLSEHATQRLSERLGYLCWNGKKIKNADPKVKKQFVLQNLETHNLKIYEHHQDNLIITTKYFSALGHLEGNLFFIETILYAGPLRYTIEEAIKYKKNYVNNLPIAS